MSKVIIIAEAGVNHNGDIVLAKHLIDAATEAGADYVKFQTFKAEEVISKYAVKAEYQVVNTNNATESQLEMVKKLQLSEEDHFILSNYCKEQHIGFLSSPFDLTSIDFLDKLNMDFFKIPSGEITNLPYLKKIASKKNKLILSTGMSFLHEIEDCITVLTNYGADRNEITVLHCNTEYPTPYQDVNLKAMLTLRDQLNVKVGYSDHTNGIEVPIAAVAMGATIIEKHFTLNKLLPGPDHKASLEPSELSKMVRSIRNIELCLGSGIKRPSTSELKNLAIARKSLVARKQIKGGDIFSEQNLTTKRPGSGISALKFDEYIGKTAKKDYEPDQLISE